MTNSALRIIFAGTPDFAATALEALINSPHEIIAVYTQPDRPAGRGRKLQASPVKQLAESHGLQIFQPENFKAAEDIEQLQQLQADLMIVVAYGLLLPRAVLQAPRLGCINIHASLLPRWRGAAPIQRAILAGDQETGVTIMQMDEGLDTGDMLLKQHCPINNKDTAGSLHDRLAEIGAQALLEVLDKMTSRTLNAEPQNDSEANYASKLVKSESWINWNDDVSQIDRQIRAFNPWPGSQITAGDKTIRIWAAEPLTDNVCHEKPGTVINADKQGIDVCCHNGVLRITQLQPPGKKVMDVPAFLNGYADLLKAGTGLAGTAQ